MLRLFKDLNVLFSIFLYPMQYLEIGTNGRHLIPESELVDYYIIVDLISNNA